ncbi:recombination protein RecR [Patescibacteria group bacterium]|nr:recombination protein RecR [Patescibacteria group bacterium]
MYPKTIQKLIERFSRFPAVGPRTAARFVFYILKLPQQETEEFIDEIQKLRKNIRLCHFCFNPFDVSDSNSKDKLCPQCTKPSREPRLCVVEKESDLEAIEKTKTYNGYYFILGGTIGSLKSEDIKQIRTEELQKRVAEPEKYGIPHSSFEEIIVALNPTTEGEATALYVERLCSSLHIPITRLGRGLPVGAELEYADEETLRSAFEGRK